MRERIIHLGRDNDPDRPICGTHAAVVAIPIGWGRWMAPRGTHGRVCYSCKMQYEFAEPNRAVELTTAGHTMVYRRV